MKKTILLAASLLLLTDLPAQQSATPSSASTGRPNILFIISDDMRTELGCYGVAGIKTPNIDQLAATSVRFQQAYAQYHLGEKGKWSKHNSLFEIGTRVPLLIRVPGGAANGRVSPRIVQTLDLYPTLVDLCGLPAPTGLEGVSLRPLLADPDAPWGRPAFSVSLRSSGDLRNIVGHTVRTERWRYAEWEGGKQGTRLIDRAADPDELVNLAADPAHASVVAEMKNLLDRFPSVASP